MFLHIGMKLVDNGRMVAAQETARRGAEGMARRKTSFQTGVTDSHKKAKPTTAAMAFCVYINLLHK